LIDNDAVTKGLTLFYRKEVMTQAEIAIAEKRKPKGIYEYMISRGNLEIVKLKNGVHLLPTSYEFDGESLTVRDFDSTFKSFENLLSELKDDYQYIFIDTQAGLNFYTQVAINREISHEVVIISEYDPMSAAGVEYMKGQLREDLTYARTWVLLNKMIPDFVKSFSDFLEVAKYPSPIPWNEEVVRAYARRRLALDLEKGNEYTLAIMQTLKVLLREEISKEIEDWAKERALALRQPIETQYKNVEAELNALDKEKYKLERSATRRRLYLSLAASSLFIIMFYVVYTFFNEFRNILDTISFPTIIIGIGSAIMFISVFISYFSKAFFTTETDRIAKIRRRQEILLDKLKKLEPLKDADIATLMKTK
ncbi:MAG: MinD/ParA family ATP-binding protein, partial [Candidatus Helarchaeota archaeon]